MTPSALELLEAEAPPFGIRAKTAPISVGICGDGTAGAALVDGLRAQAVQLPGAGNAVDVVLIVVDARTGLLARSRRQIFLASALGPKVALVVEMDSAELSEAAFARVRDDCGRLLEQAKLSRVSCIPVSAATGDNVAAHSTGMPWYRGPTLLGFLESIEAPPAAERQPLRMFVDSASAPASGGCVATGTIASGVARRGDGVRAQPSGQLGKIARILGDDGELEHAGAGQKVRLAFSGLMEIGRGDLIAAADEPAQVADQFEATVVWTGAAPLLRGRSYRLEIGTTAATATIAPLKYKINVESFERVASAKLEAREIGVCGLQLDRAIAFDPYPENRATGGFTLVDPLSRDTVGVGMLHFALRRAQNVHWQAVDVNKAARSRLLGQKPCVLWYTGLSGAGKSTIANLVDKKLHAMNRHTYLLDGDNVRHGLNKDLGFTAADRVENIRRIAEVAKLMVDAGLIVGTAFISPFRAEREMARALLPAGEFFEIFVDTPLGVAEERDPKGLYKKARRGELKNFTGIDSPYEAPDSPEIRIDTTVTSPEAAAELVVGFLEARGVFGSDV
jgi:bifunctional enzyme CysN/CysC